MAGPLLIGEPVPESGELPAQALTNSDQRTLHAYIHIPFCRVRCGYCDFNTYTATELDGVSQGDFASVLIQEIELSKRITGDRRKLESVFFGGGTPTQLPAADLVKILDALRGSFGLTDGAEITTEANPDNVNEHYLGELAAGGFTRVSFGMQSAVPNVLQTLERTHQPENVPLAVAAAKMNGLSTSVDLIYGAPGETLDDWRVSLDAAISMEPDHISAYSLIVEEGTKLARQIKRGELPEPDEDLQADKYELADSLLESAGFNWYEVSNWSKSPETASRHNLAYWLGNDWWGYGPGAHSHFGGVRWWNAKHPSAYSNRLNQGLTPAVGREVLDESTRLAERILLEIRIRPGLSVDVVKQVSESPSRLIAKFIADGLIEGPEAISGRLVLTLKGRLLADSLVRQILN
ncbi:MAG: Heme chaperone HemW [Actinomycetota bacterium]|jgi:oxygen-independent coproporphyrinogen-3 oxidase